MDGRFLKWMTRPSGAWLMTTSLVTLLLAADCGAPPPEKPAVQTKPKPKVAENATPQPERPPLPDVDLETLPGRVHIVQAGDTLYSLAEKYYGHGRHYQKILMANRKRLTDPNDLPVGMKLIIP